MNNLQSFMVHTQWIIQLGIILPQLPVLLGVNMVQQPAALSFNIGSLQEYI